MYAQYVTRTFIKNATMQRDRNIIFYPDSLVGLNGSKDKL